MTTLKRLLISLAAGIVIVFSLLFTTLLAYKLFFPGSTSVAVWLLAWPVLLFGGLFPSLGRNMLLVSSISIAMIFYVAAATAAVFLVLRFFMRNRPTRQASSPPGPPSF